MDSNTPKGSTTLRMSPTETLQDNSTPGTMKSTSFGFPGVAKCTPDSDAESTTITGTGADTAMTRSSNRNRIETSPLGEAPTLGATSQREGVSTVKQRTNGQMWHSVQPRVELSRKELARLPSPASSQIPDPSNGSKRNQSESASNRQAHQSTPLLESCVALIRHVVQQLVHLRVLRTSVSQHFKPTRTSPPTLN